MKNTPLVPELSQDEKNFLKAMEDANGYAITLQDKKRKDSETVYTKHPISKEMYDYYFAHFIRLWGKKITFESLDGTKADGYLNSIIVK